MWPQDDTRDEWNGQEAGHRQTARLAELQRWSGETKLGETTNTRAVRVLEQVLQAEPPTKVDEPVHCQEDRGVPQGKTGLGQVLPHQQRNTGDDYRWQRSSWRSSLWRGSWQNSFTGQDDWTGGGQSHPDQGEPWSDPWAHELHGESKMMKMSRVSFRTQLMDGRPIATTPQLSPTGGLVTKMKTGPMRHQSSCQNSSKDGIS